MTEHHLVNGTMALSVTSSLSINTSGDGDSTISLCSPFHCQTTLISSCPIPYLPRRPTPHHRGYKPFSGSWSEGEKVSPEAPLLQSKAPQQLLTAFTAHRAKAIRHFSLPEMLCGARHSTANFAGMLYLSRQGEFLSEWEAG